MYAIEHIAELDRIVSRMRLDGYIHTCVIPIARTDTLKQHSKVVSEGRILAEVDFEEILTP